MNPVIVRRTRVVTIPVDVVWQFIEPVDLLPVWLPLANRAEHLDGEGLGRRQRMHSSWRGRANEIDQRVTAYEENRRLAWTHVAERVDGKPAPVISREVTVTVDLDPVGAGTRVTLESRQVPSGVLAGLWLRLFVARRVGRAFDRALQNLASAGN
jgi:uncharacterized protein YndB with AHSA1/START domain